MLAIGTALALAIPATAYANTVSGTVNTPGATSGPATAFAEISTHADCSGGFVAGGGVNQAIGTGTSPSPEGSTEYTGSTGVVGTDATHWLGIGGSGAVNASFSSTPYAMCCTSDLINHTQVVMNKVTGPTSASTVGLVTPTCPANTRLLGGGARTMPADVGSLKPIASLPSFDDAAHDHGRKAARTARPTRTPGRRWAGTVAAAARTTRPTPRRSAAGAASTSAVRP